MQGIGQKSSHALTEDGMTKARAKRSTAQRARGGGAAVDHDDNQILSFPFKRWLNNSILTTRKSVHRQLFSLISLTGDEINESLIRGTVQGRILSDLIARRSNDVLRDSLRKQFQRYASNLFGDDYDHEAHP